MRFPARFWRKFEFPTMEKLNSMIDALVNHARRKRNLANGEWLYQDPGDTMEHWASAIRTTGKYNDVQEALDDPLTSSILDRSLPLIIVAPSSQQGVVKADHYLKNDQFDGPGSWNALVNSELLLGGGTIYFLPGIYELWAPVGIRTRPTILGSPGATEFRFHYGQIYYDDPTDNYYPTPPYISRFQILAPEGVDGYVTFKNITFTGGFFSPIRGTSFILDGCTFLTKKPNPYTFPVSDNYAGLVRTEAVEGVSNNKAKIKNCSFYLLDRIILSRFRYPYFYPILHEFGDMDISSTIIHKIHEEHMWFGTGIRSQTQGGYLTLRDSSLRTYDECVWVKDGAFLMERSSAYRYGSLVEVDIG